MNSTIELMAPAGSFPTLHAAIKAGANSIYFGINKLNMRSGSSNKFTIEDLPEIARICQENNVRSYMTLNSVLYDNDLELMKHLCNLAKENNLSAIIASDIAAIQHAKTIDLNVHLSTQLNISNLEAVKFFSKFSDVMVLARELSLEKIQYICKKIIEENITGPSGKLVKIEIFIHGALCVGISGKCYMSLAQYNKSANRGECLQACRRKYLVKEVETGKELEIDNQYIMSPKDLCTLPYLDKIVHSGVSILKIEGRGRSCEYVHHVVSTYKKALQTIEKNTFNESFIKESMSTLQSVYNRGFWEGGYYLDQETSPWSESHGSKATTKKRYIGKISNYFSKIQIAECKIEAGNLSENDYIYIQGNKTGFIKHQIQSLKIFNTSSTGEKGLFITFPIKEKLRFNDQIYLVEANG